MYNKKYMFEGQLTKYQRYLRGSLMWLFIIISVYLVVAFALLIIAGHETTKSETYFYKKRPDLIAVFTGDIGRIHFTFKKAIEFDQSKIFISGVHAKNTVDILLEKQAPSDIKDLQTRIDSNQLEIDYLAKNTIENVISVLRFVRKNQGMNQVLIISHDYHIARIRSIVNLLRDQNSGVEFFYYGIRSNYLSLRNIKILMKEVYKLIRSFAFLWPWESDLEELPVG